MIPRRVVPVLALAEGVALLARPEAVVRAATGRPSPHVAVLRVLGARQLVQGCLVLARPTPQAYRTAAVVDGLHALSMLPVLLHPRYRRAALVSLLLGVGASAVAAATADAVS